MRPQLVDSDWGADGERGQNEVILNALPSHSALSAGYGVRYRRARRQSRVFPQIVCRQEGSGTEAEHSSAERTEAGVSTCKNGTRKRTVTEEREGKAKSFPLAERLCSVDRRM